MRGVKLYGIVEQDQDWRSANALFNSKHLCGWRALIKPLLISRGKGLRNPQAETRAYNHRVVVKFQPNARCDEEMMLYWCRHIWKRPFS